MAGGSSAAGGPSAPDGGADPGAAGSAPALVSESQVEAMISLLTDESEAVVAGCHRALLAHPEMAEPMLRERLAQTDAGAGAFQAVLDDIERRRVEARLVETLRSGPGLEEGSILIGRMVDPGVATPAIAAALDAMADQVDAEPGRLTDPLAALIDVMVRQNALKGVDPSLAHPVDAVLHGVTTRRRGLPLPLCLAWILVARRARLPLVGVNMPGHFLVRYGRGAESSLIDPFHRGLAVSEAHCRAYLARSGFAAGDVFKLDATDRDMLLRTLRNLAMIGGRRGDRELVRRCGRILSAVESDAG